MDTGEVILVSMAYRLGALGESKIIESKNKFKL